MRKTNNATQFSGSAIVNVPTGGKKKKFRHRVAVTAAAIAIHRRPNAATQRTANNNASAAVVGLTCIPDLDGTPTAGASHKKTISTVGGPRCASHNQAAA